MTRSKVRSRLTTWARFVRLMVMGEGLVGEKVQMSSGVSRGDMRGVKASRLVSWGAMGRGLRPRLRARPRRQGYTRGRVCVKESSNGQAGQRFPKRDDE